MPNCNGLCNRKIRSVRLGEKRCCQATGRREGQPQPRNSAVARNVNQVSAECGREAAKNCCGHAVSESKTRRSYINGHDLGQENDHRAVVTAVEKRKPE